jgi:hypothetical protein
MAYLREHGGPVALPPAVGQWAYDALAYLQHRNSSSKETA